MQSYVLIIATLLIGVVAIVFARIVAQSGTEVSSKSGGVDLESRRSALFWSLAVVGFVLTYATLRPWPHDASATEGSVTVAVTGSQWSWEISKKELPAGTPIIFNVASNDVNHGFGVYDASGTLLFQTQAMPGVINQVRYTFAKAGAYAVLCMEYCGLVHHDMKDELKVVSK